MARNGYSAKHINMEGFTYTNIFETKGVEYIAIIAFFLVLVPFWLFLNRPVKQSLERTKLKGFLTLDSIKVPMGIFFSKFHTWAHLESSGAAKVGLSHMLVRITGTVRFSNLRTQGEQIQKGDLLASIQKDGKILNVFAPISGEIRETNVLLLENPGLVSEDPYNSGWIYKIVPENWTADTHSYYLADKAKAWIESELNRFRDFLSSAMSERTGLPAVALQDGGELTEQPLSGLPEEIWQSFQQEFLSDMSVPTANLIFSGS